jgi:hypothetical protein
MLPHREQILRSEIAIIEQQMAYRLLSTPIDRQPPNGWRYRRLGRKRTGNGKLLEFRKSQKTRRVPTCPLHALLGSLLPFSRH